MPRPAPLTTHVDQPSNSTPFPTRKGKGTLNGYKVAVSTDGKKVAHTWQTSDKAATQAEGSISRSHHRVTRKKEKEKAITKTWLTTQGLDAFEASSSDQKIVRTSSAGAILQKPYSQLKKHLSQVFIHQTEKTAPGDLATIKQSQDIWNDQAKLNAFLEKMDQESAATFEACQERLFQLLSYEISDIARGRDDFTPRELFLSSCKAIEEAVDDAHLASERKQELKAELKEAQQERKQRLSHLKEFVQTAKKIRRTKKLGESELNELQKVQKKLQQQINPKIKQLGDHLEAFISALNTKDETALRMQLLADELSYVFSRPEGAFQKYCDVTKKQTRTYLEKSLQFNSDLFPETATRVPKKTVIHAINMQKKLLVASKNDSFKTLQKELTEQAVNHITPLLQNSEKHFERIVKAGKKLAGNSNYTQQLLMEALESMNNSGSQALFSMLNEKNTTSALYVYNLLSSCLKRDRRFLEDDASPQEKIELSTPAIHEHCQASLEVRKKNLETLIEYNMSIKSSSQQLES